MRTDVLAALASWGADPEEAVRRCADDVELYEMCLSTFADDHYFDVLYEAATDQQRLEAAHTLKGVAGNLSLTPLHTELGLIVAELRAGDTARIAARVDQVRTMQTQFAALLQ